jgi:CRP/FNR family transcriptional regulator
VITTDDLRFLRSRLEFYEDLSDSEMRDLEKAVMKASYPRGATLRSKRTECLGVLLVRSGGLRVYILSEDGREVTLYRLGPGEVCVLSASCILNSITFDVHIDADQDSEIYQINIGTFDLLMKNNLRVENFTLRNALEKFSDVMWAMEQILFMRFDKRLAVFLLDESARVGAAEVKLTHEEIAKYLGSAREVVSRMLKAFQAEGILEQSRGIIRILDKNKLKGLL